MRSELEPEEVLRGQGGRLTVAEEELAASEPAAAASTSVAAFSRRFPRKKKSISRESERLGLGVGGRVRASRK
jgi:hypothetical protein